MRRFTLAAFAALLSVASFAAADSAKPKQFKPAEDGDGADPKHRASDQPHVTLDDDSKKDDVKKEDGKKKVGAEDSGFALASDKSTRPPAPRVRPSGVSVIPSSYGGVIPGGANLPPHSPQRSAGNSKGSVRMMWPGFQVRDGVPTVFLELTGPVEWSALEAPGKLVYTLKNTTIPLKNNTRTLRVGEFQTAIDAIDARPAGRDVRVTISLKHPVTHKESVEDAAGGFKLLVVGMTPRE